MSPLPVTLISFTGKRVENKNLLEWKVTDESKFQGYEVERSTTGKNVEKIATVAAIVNKKTAPTDYQFVDDIPTTASFFIGIFYYRLKMIDLDGSFALSG